MRNTDPERPKNIHLHPSNVFTIVDIVLLKEYDEQYSLLQCNRRYATKDLHFTVVSKDVPEEEEHFPTSSLKADDGLACLTSIYSLLTRSELFTA